MIISRYLKTVKDFENLEKSCKEYRGTVNRFKYNPITFNNLKEREVFKNIETYHIYDRETPRIGKTEINKILRDKRIKRLIIWNEKDIDKIERDPKIEYKHLIGEYSTELDSDINVLKGITKTISREDVRDIIVPTQITKLAYCCFGAVRQALIHISEERVPSTEIKSITIPTTVSSIGEACFANCFSLNKINIPTTVSELELETFCGCSQLSTINIPESVTKIGGGCFAGCKNLSYINLPTTLEDIPPKCFEKCKKLLDIKLTDNLKRLGSGCFENCRFNTINIPSSVSWIGNTTFHKCKNLYEISLPSSVSRLENYCFYECTELSTVTCSSNIEYIGDRCFCGTTGLVNIHFHERAKFPEGYIEIPSKVTFIGSSCFEKCSQITKVKIDGPVKEIPINCFNQCCFIKGIELPKGLQVLGSCCFRYCNGINDITIPSSVTSIRNDTFTCCKTNLNVYFEPGSSISHRFKKNGKMIREKTEKPKEKKPFPPRNVENRVFQTGFRYYAYFN